MRSSLSRSSLALAVWSLTACSGPRDLSVKRAAILGGEPDTETTAVVGLAANLGFAFAGHCTGTLIAPNLVLTARHCVALTQDPGGSVICGESGFTFTGPASFFRATTKAVRPTEEGPAFYKGAGGYPFTEGEADDICGWDVALLMLEESIPPSEATPIEPRLAKPAVVGERFTAVGYGLTEADGTQSGTRMRLEDNEVLCLGAVCLGAQVKAGEFGSNAAACSGDSGGPALDSAGRVFGVLSRGPQGCKSSVHGDVSAHRELIVKAAVAAAKAGGYPLPEWARAHLPPDAGVDGGGDAGVDLGVEPGSDAGETDAEVVDAGDVSSSSSSGCAVAGAGFPALPLVPLLLVALRRRYRPG